MGSNTIIAIVVGAILVIVGFALWPVLNGASNSLYSYFQDSCDDGNGNRFGKMYQGATGDLPSGGGDADKYYTGSRQHGGAGVNITEDGGDCAATLSTWSGTADYYTEQGEQIGSLTAASNIVKTDAPFVFVEVAPMLKRFSGINNLLLTVIPVVSIAGFLGISGAKLYSYGKGTSSIGSSISTSVFTLIGIVIAMVIAGPVLGQAVAANQVVVSGQYEVNGTFGNIISLLFAMIPVIYIAGLVTLVGLQARTALMGGKSDGSMG